MDAVAVDLCSCRYEVGRFFGAVERLKRAAEEQNSREAQRAFAAMSVAYDRYLKVADGRNMLSTVAPRTVCYVNGMGDGIELVL